MSGMTPWQQEAGQLYRAAYRLGVEARPEMEKALRDGLEYSPPAYVRELADQNGRRLRRDAVLALGWLHGMEGVPRDTTAAYDLAAELAP